MPIMNGNECVKLVREYEKENDIENKHFIIGSSAVSADDFWQKFPEGFSIFQRKPIKAADI